MKREIELKQAVIVNKTESVRVGRRMNARLRRWSYSLLAVFGIFGGLSALFVGIVLVIIHGFMKSDAVFDRVGTGLLIVALPMILIGSIFLDLINDNKI
jgi:H+/Cl- antiporter ClcA